MTVGVNKARFATALLDVGVLPVGGGMLHRMHPVLWDTYVKAQYAANSYLHACFYPRKRGAMYDGSALGAPVLLTMAEYHVYGGHGGRHWALVDTEKLAVPAVHIQRRLGLLVKFYRDTP